MLRLLFCNVWAYLCRQKYKVNRCLNYQETMEGAVAFRRSRLQPLLLICCRGLISHDVTVEWLAMVLDTAYRVGLVAGQCCASYPCSPTVLAE
jgi:hypothetical protein